MNYRGSYRKLLGNAKAAIVAAIEIYNKPIFEYRDECVVILLLNAWELLLKGVISHRRENIFYKKRRKESYRTLSWADAFGRAEKYFPSTIDNLAVRKNLDLLGTFRDNSVHFYNSKDFGVLLYALAQTCIKNFRDLMEKEFDARLEDEINWQLLPIGIHPPVDLISYIGSSSSRPKSAAVRQFLAELAKATEELKASGGDTGRLLTVFTVKLESVKKIGEADAVVAVGSAQNVPGPLAIVRTQDPNASHPLRQMDVIKRIESIHGHRFTSHVFSAISWKYKLKENSTYCWKASEGVLTKYSLDVVAFINRLGQADVEDALSSYSSYLKSRQRKPVVRRHK